MYRYYLKEDNKSNSISLEGIPIHKEKEKNQLMERLKANLSKYVEKGIICVEEIDATGKAKTFTKKTIIKETDKVESITETDTTISTEATEVSTKKKRTKKEGTNA